MKKSTYFIQTNQGIKTINGMTEKHGNILIHRPYNNQERVWIISSSGFKITTAKKINQAREIAKFLKEYSFINENAINYFKKHQEYIKNVLSTFK